MLTIKIKTTSFMTCFTWFSLLCRMTLENFRHDGLVSASEMQTVPMLTLSRGFCDLVFILLVVF